MALYGLRLLVALITFGVGVTAGRLLGSESRADCGKRAASYAPVKVAAPALDAPPLPRLPPPPPSYPSSSCSAVNLAPRVVQGGLLNAKAVSKPVPAYPAEARAAGVRGTVSVSVEVDVNGRVTSADARSGPPMLREAAEEAAREARFAPTRVAGEAVRVWGTVTYHFAPQ